MNRGLEIFKQRQKLRGYQSGSGGVEPESLPETDYYGYTNSGASTAASGQDTAGHGSNPGGFTPMFIGDWHPPVDDGTGAPSDGGNTSGGGGGDSGTGRPSDQDVIRQLGYDPGDPRNNLSTTGGETGVPTQRGIGMIANFLGNAAFPGLGMLTGPMASKITQMIQNGASQRAVQNAISGATGGGSGGDAGGGGGFHFPEGGFYSPDYLKSIGYTPGQGTGSLWPAEHGYIPGGRFSPLPGSFAGLGSFSGAAPFSGSWGNINSPIGRAALSGVQFDPAKMPSPGFRIPGATGPGNMPIINWAAFGQGVSPGQSAHFQPRSVQ